MTWEEDAACATVDPAIFFPEKSVGWRPTEMARKVCATCPVRAECLADSPTWDQFSVRGGLTATERSALRAKAAA